MVPALELVVQVYLTQEWHKKDRPSEVSVSRVRIRAKIAICRTRWGWVSAKDMGMGRRRVWIQAWGRKTLAEAEEEVKVSVEVGALLDR
jgi:hypothetical protein